MQGGPPGVHLVAGSLALLGLQLQSVLHQLVLGILARLQLGDEIPENIGFYIATFTVKLNLGYTI